MEIFRYFGIKNLTTKRFNKDLIQPVFSCSKSTVETPEQCLKAFQSQHFCNVSIIDFEQLNAG